MTFWSSQGKVATANSLGEVGKL